MVLSSFKPSGELFSYPLHLFSQDPTVEHYASVLAGGFMGYVKNSLFLAVVGTLITLVISSMCGYALAIYRFEIKYVNLVFGVFLLGTLIPGETLTVPQFSVISALGLYNNIWGVILPVVTTTTGIFMYRQHYMSIPLSFVEAARIDGANELQIFTRIMFPLGSSVTVTLTIFSFMWRWNDYILPLLVLSDQKNTPSRSPSKTLSAIWALTGALSWRPPCCPSFRHRDLHLPAKIYHWRHLRLRRKGLTCFYSPRGAAGARSTVFYIEIVKLWPPAGTRGGHIWYNNLKAAACAAARVQSTRFCAGAQGLENIEPSKTAARAVCCGRCAASWYNMSG